MILPTSGVYQQRVYLQGNSPVAGFSNATDLYFDRKIAARGPAPQSSTMPPAIVQQTPSTNAFIGLSSYMSFDLPRHAWSGL